MRLGIDASNLRAGGGVTHLVEMLRVADPSSSGFGEVIVWGGSGTLSRIEDRPWLRKVHEQLLDQRLIKRLYWQRFKLAKLARHTKIDVLFVPGGTYSGNFRPFVTMSRNMLPFEVRERQRYGLSWMRLKLGLLESSQSDTFRRADGLIFLTRYAQDIVLHKIGAIDCPIALIPHGVDERFRLPPRHQRSIGTFTIAKPFRILYVSSIDVYKHQWHVAQAVIKLVNQGVPVELNLVGPAYPPALQRLRKVMTDLDSAGRYIHYWGAVPYSSLPRNYKEADTFVFASSCENMPNILIEAMAAGLPIACSNRGPMPEILGASGSYFDPEDSDSIVDSLFTLLQDATQREQYAWGAYQRATKFSWQQCAEDTFEFIRGVVNSRK